MRSELDLLAEGVVFTRRESDNRIRATGKSGSDIRTEVAERIPLVKARIAGGPSRSELRWGQCDVCGLAMRDYAGGNCFLCDCATQKILDEMQSNQKDAAGNVIVGYDHAFEDIAQRTGSMNSPSVKYPVAPWEKK